ncbi:MAG: FliA/WhiG family RNA polymerase sigma factor [Proteobacteria bacterium]|nr:FliA/WhiG family RNA polymerase sigma factor [Pseudomonadota bacterium]
MESTIVPITSFTPLSMQNPYQKQKEVNKETIVLECAPMVKHIANRLSARLPDSFQTDDLIQAGMIGLLEAIEKFDPKREIKFKTYAEIRVRGAMLDDLRAKDWIPRSVRDNGTKLEAAYRELRAENIDHPTDRQLAKKLGLPTRELVPFLDKSKPIPLLSLESLGALRSSSSDESLDILETLSDPDEKDPVETLLGGEAQDLVRNALDRLPEKEKLVLSLYYNEDLNLKEIGAVLDISESRVSQLRTKAIGILRSYMSAQMDE